jgi:hypothetical protein
MVGKGGSDSGMMICASVAMRLASGLIEVHPLGLLDQE